MVVFSADATQGVGVLGDGWNNSGGKRGERGKVGKNIAEFGDTLGVWA